MKKYIQSDQLQKYIDLSSIMEMPRYAGGHDDQMRGLFKNSSVVAHWNEGDYQGRVATCVQFTKGNFKGKFAIYNDYYGSCSGCDSWEGAGDDAVRNMCIGLSNNAYVFKTIEDVKAFLSSTDEDENWSSWSNVRLNLLKEIEKSEVITS